MSAIQVKDFPEDLHRALRLVSVRTGVPIGTLITATMATALGLTHPAAKQVKAALHDWGLSR